jgi:FAD/FMN-containing dehydrogenase
LKNVLEWETVLANGTIANIKASERPELARAMRGGGSQFGIVTKFTLRAYPIGNVWGGERSWAAKDAAAVFEGFADFVENNHKDPKAAVIFTANGGATSAQMVYFDEKPPPPNAFGKLGAVKASKDSTKMTTYPAIVSAAPWTWKSTWLTFV